MLIKNFPHILHGGDYNPDQWLDTPEIIDEDFRLMDRAHCNTFSVGIFSWGQIEVEEGKYEFGWLDDIFDRAAKAGKKLFLATPTAARPGWMGQKYPETAMVDENGQRIHWMIRQNACLSSPVFREKTRAINRKLAERYAHHPALAGWHISNEYSVQCHCPLCRKRFAEFLKERYKTLENLNRHYWSAFWGHTLTAWDQIYEGDWGVNIVRIDWLRFVTQLHLEFMQLEIDAVREFSDLPVTTNMMGYFSGLDYWKIAKLCDFVSDDCYPEWGPGFEPRIFARYGLLHDMHYAMKNKPFLMMESCPGVPNYYPRFQIRRPNELQREMLLSIAHGSDGTMYFQWRKGRGNIEQAHGAVIGHDGTDKTLTFKGVAEYGTKLERIAEVIDSERKPEIAIVLDWESRWALNTTVGFGRPAVHKNDETLIDHYQALSELGYETAVIDQDQPFEPYKVILAPMLYMLKDGMIEKMTRFVENGGTLVLTYLSACADQSNRWFSGGNPGGPALRKLFGIWSEDVDGLLPDTKQCVLWKGKNYQTHDYAEYLHAEGAEVVGLYSSEFYAGTPAVTVNRAGKGHAVYIGARTGLDFLKDFYADLLLKNNIHPLMRGLPAGVHAARRIGKNAAYYFLLNMSAEPIRVVLPEPMTDIWNGGTQPVNSIELETAGGAVLKKSL